MDPALDAAVRAELKRRPSLNNPSDFALLGAAADEAEMVDDPDLARGLRSGRCPCLIGHTVRWSRASCYSTKWGRDDLDNVEDGLFDRLGGVVILAPPGSCGSSDVVAAQRSYRTWQAAFRDLGRVMRETGVTTSRPGPVGAEVSERGGIMTENRLTFCDRDGGYREPTDPTGAALARACAATPGDRLPRLAYYDWLTDGDHLTRADIAAAMARWPHLTAFGFGVYRRPNRRPGEYAADFDRGREALLGAVTEVAWSLVWLAGQTARRTVDRGRTSYEFKHRVEDMTGHLAARTYVSNGAFVAAADVAGFLVLPDFVGPNAVFNFSRRATRRAEIAEGR